MSSHNVAHVSGNEYHITLQRPIKGPSTYKVEIIGSDNAPASIRSHTATDGKTEIETAGTIHTSDTETLLSAINDVRGFPTSANEDIYGLDTAVQFNTKDNGQWNSTDAMTDVRVCEQESKDQFKEFVEIIEKLARKHSEDSAV